MFQMSENRLNERANELETEQANIRPGASRAQDPNRAFREVDLVFVCSLCKLQKVLSAEKLTC